MAPLLMGSIPEASEQALSCGCDIVGLQVGHASMMTQWANSLLARPTIHFQSQMNGSGKVRLGPGDVRWAEQRDDRNIECRCEMARAAIRGDKQGQSLDHRLGQA
jgi:hypothetical protein